MPQSSMSVQASEIGGRDATLYRAIIIINATLANLKVVKIRLVVVTGLGGSMGRYLVYVQYDKENPAWWLRTDQSELGELKYDQ